MSGVTRRRVLGSIAAGVACSLALPRALAIGPGSRFRIGQLVLAGAGPVPRPTALRRLAWEIDKRTSIDAALDPVDVHPGDPTLHETPFLVLAGDRRIPPMSLREVEALRRFLTFGGFLVVDSAEAQSGGAFDASVRELVETIFPRPTQGLAVLPGDHVLYRSFYLLEAAAGRVLAAPRLEGVVHDGRVVLVYSLNDLGGAWARDNFGNWEHECYPGGEAQREQAFRLGVNLAMYALCLDYKTDQVHVPFILKRRRWKAE